MKSIQGMWYFLVIFKGETKAMSVWSPDTGSLWNIRPHMIKKKTLIWRVNKFLSMKEAC